MTFSEPKRALPFLAAAMLVLLAGRAEAQFPLSPALWQENISLDVQTIESQMTSFMGSDPNAPEPRTEALTGIGYDVTGSIEFGSTESPEGTAQVTWDISEAGAALNLTSIVNIDFQVRVIETAPPPVSVTEVPVHLLATGSVSVEQIFGPRATSSFSFRVIGTSVVISANLDLYGDPDSTKTTDSFTIDETPLVPPDVVVLVSMSAAAQMGTVGTGGTATGSAVGMVDPIIEIADETIPGTTNSYRDFFTVEFSDGYNAQTPVIPVTWGQLKQLFNTQR